MADLPIASILADLGFVEVPERARARAALEDAGLTRAGKTAINDSKLARVRELLARRFALSCAACVQEVRAARPEAELLLVADLRCEHCGGSDHQAAALRFRAACEGRAQRILVVGGSPTTRLALKRLLDHLDVRLVDGTGALTSTRARQLHAWADLVLIWGATQLSHRVSSHFTTSRSSKIVVAAKRGISGLLDAGTEHLQGIAGHRVRRSE